jgi:uncharacterized protein (DUF983 family)
MIKSFEAKCTKCGEDIGASKGIDGSFYIPLLITLDNSAI